MKFSKARALSLIVLVVLVAISLWRAGTAPPAEKFSSGDVVGFAIDADADPGVTAALDRLAEKTAWLACVPSIQLEKIALAQTKTGVTTLKSVDLLEGLKAHKNAVLADILRLPYSPEFKSGLVRYTDYVLTAFSETIKAFTDKDGFVNLKSVAESLAELRGSYCADLSKNFGVGNSFLPATA